MSSELSKNIQHGIANALENDRVSDVDRVTEQECSSDNFSGVQIDVYGPWVDVRTVIDYVAGIDGVAIEDMAHVDEGEPHLFVFIAYLPVQDHPAFI